MYKSIKYVFAFIVAITSCFTVSFAQQPNPLNQIIDKVAKTYGVDKLSQARTIRIEEDVRIIYADHDYSPDFNQFTHGRRFYVFDLKNEKASAEYYTNFSGNVLHARIFEVPEGYVMIDYGNATYIPQPDTTYLSEFGSVIRGSDTLLAYELIKNKPTAQYFGSTLWLGKPHDIISFDFPNSPPLVLYVQQGSGYISKMTRTIPQGDTNLVISYTFSDHQKRKGTAYAREHTVFIGRDLLLTANNRKVVINTKSDRNNFKLDKGIVLEPARIDTSEMTVEHVAGQTHYVGQENAYSAFIETENYLIALGASAGFADRMKAYKDRTKSAKPLGYVMVTDHHENEMAGVLDAAKLGATLLATPSAKPVLERMFEGTELSPKIETIDDMLSKNGITFMNISTGHAQNVLVAYSADSKALYQADHYISPFANERFYTKNSAVTLHNAIKNKGFDIDWLLSSESRKPEKWEDFILALKAHKPNYCPPKRKICEGL